MIDAGYWLCQITTVRLQVPSPPLSLSLAFSLVQLFLPCLKRIVSTLVLFTVLICTCTWHQCAVCVTAHTLIYSCRIAAVLSTPMYWIHICPRPFAMLENIAHPWWKKILHVKTTSRDCRSKSMLKWWNVTCDASAVFCYWCRPVSMQPGSDHSDRCIDAVRQTNQLNLRWWPKSSGKTFGLEKNPKVRVFPKKTHCLTFRVILGLFFWVF